MHVEKVSSARLIVLAAVGISGTGKSSSVLSGDLRYILGVSVHKITCVTLARGQP